MLRVGDTAGVDRGRAFERDPDTLWRSTVRGVLLKPGSRREPMLLTTPGDAVWRTLAEAQTVASLVAALADEFAAPAERIEADIEPVLDELIGCGAIRYTSSEA